MVNGDVISANDVDLRRRLFAVSTGQGVAPDVLDRLTTQVTKQLIDERLRLQEVQRRHIVVTDQEIAAAIANSAQRNTLPAGGQRARLGAAGIDIRTLIDQLRVQLGWGRVVREQLGHLANVSDDRHQGPAAAVEGRYRQAGIPDQPRSSCRSPIPRRPTMPSASPIP